MGQGMNALLLNFTHPPLFMHKAEPGLGTDPEPPLQQIVLPPCLLGTATYSAGSRSAFDLL